MEIQTGETITTHIGQCQDKKQHREIKEKHRETKIRSGGLGGKHMTNYNKSQTNQDKVKYDLKNNLIFRYLNILDKLNSINRPVSDLENNKYTYEEKIEYIKSIAKDSELDIELDIYLEYLIREFLLDIDIPRQAEDIENLTGIKLLKYMIKIIDTIQIKTSIQRQSLVVLKYNKQINETGFHNLQRVCRGKVINVKTHEIVQYPYDKFFNIDENNEYSLDKIKDRLECAKYISVTEKVDGCLVAVTQTDKTKSIQINKKSIDKLVIQTMGQFDNEQVQIAKAILIKQRSVIKPERTYIFELITPTEKHVVDYGNLETLILTNIRDLRTYKLLKYNELKEERQQLNIPIVKQYEYSNIDEFIAKASETETDNTKSLEHEGWVFRLDNKHDETFLFKLKYKEYFRLSRQKSNISPEKLFTIIKAGKYDDYLNQVEDIDVEAIEQLKEELDIRVKEEVDRILKRGYVELEKLDISLYEFNTDRQKRATVIKHLKQLSAGMTIVKVLSRASKINDIDISSYYQLLKYDNMQSIT